MNIQKNARLAGALFLIATAASLIGGNLVESFTSPAAAYENRVIVVTGVLLELVNAASVVGIAALIYPMLKRQNAAIASGYLGMRIIESAFCAAAVVSPLSLISLGRAGTAIQADGTLSIAQRAVITGMLVPVFFVLGALLFYRLLFRSSLVPRFISVWGFIAVVSVLFQNLASAFIEISTVARMMLALPIIFNEVFLGIWLIAKGFNQQNVDMAYGG